MNVQINKIGDFINSIHDYILETFEISPRDFETTLLLGDKSLAWNRRTHKITEFECKLFNKRLHAHENEINVNDYIVCCSQVDIIALRYLNGSIFDNDAGDKSSGGFKHELISSMHSWLPAATFQNVRVRFLKRNATVTSYFEPSFLFYLLHDIDKYQITYNYLYSNIVNHTNYTLSETVMVKGRRRSRSSSPAPYSKKRSSRRGRSRSRSPSQTRYRSPSGSRRSNRGGRRRRRSMSN